MSGTIEGRQGDRRRGEKEEGLTSGDQR